MARSTTIPQAEKYRSEQRRDKRRRNKRDAFIKARKKNGCPGCLKCQNGKRDELLAAGFNYEWERDGITPNRFTTRPRVREREVFTQVSKPEGRSDTVRDLVRHTATDMRPAAKPQPVTKPVYNPYAHKPKLRSGVGLKQFRNADPRANLTYEHRMRLIS